MVVFSNTHKLNHFYDFVPPQWITPWHKKVGDARLNALLDSQELIKNHPMFPLWSLEDPGFQRMGVIMDDVIDEKYAIHSSRGLTRVFTLGRHHDVFTICNTQYHKSIQPSMRNNTDVAAMFYAGSFDVKRDLFRLYGMAWLDEPLFLRLFDATTRNHGALIFYQTDTNERRLTRKFFYARVPKQYLDVEFKMGRPEDWRKGGQGSDESEWGDGMKRPPVTVNNQRVDLMMGLSSLGAAYGKPVGVFSDRR